MSSPLILPRDFLVPTTPDERARWAAKRYGHGAALEEFPVGSDEGFEAAGRYAAEVYENVLGGTS